MIRTLRACAISAIIAGAFALQAPQPKQIPKCEGKECEGGHEGQPKWCANYDTPGYLHNCACKEMNPGKCHEPDKDEEEGGGESSKCSVYCRKNACRCSKGCDTE